MRTLIKARKIYTLCTPNTFYNSLIVENGVITEIGNDLIVSASDETIHWNNKIILPSFNDSHMHLLGYAQSLRQCALEGLNSIRALQDTIIAFSKTTSQPWIIGRGWNQDHFDEQRLPNKDDLDQLGIDLPMVFYRACGHIALLNSKALETIGIHVDLKISGGAIDCVDEHPTGILRESALDLLTPYLPKPSLEEWAVCLEKAIDNLNAYGITSVQSDDLSFLEVDALIALFQTYPQVNIKVYEQSQFTTLDALQNAIDAGYKQNMDFGLFRLGPLKILADGSLGARTARMSEPYCDAPSERGLLIYTREKIERLIAMALENNIDVAIHGIGDETIQIAIDAFKTYQDDSKTYRNSIVHCQIMHENQINEMAKHRIHALVQPVFLEYDMAIVKSRVGESLAKSSYAYRTMLDQGIRLGFGSDCPVEDPNPFRSLYYAVSRTHPSGVSYNPSEGITLFEAWRAFSSDAAFFSYEEHTKGLLLPGHFADFVVLEDDPFEMPIRALLDMHVTATYLNGRCVYKR